MATASGGGGNESEVLVGGAPALPGTLALPDAAWSAGPGAVPRGVVLFAHGSGSSRHSPRNRYVAEVLRAAGCATLLLDLLTPDEDRDSAARFDIGLLAERLDAACTWLRLDERTEQLPIGLFGASTGAGAALRLAAERGGDIAAVVSRGGRPDLAGATALAGVAAPVLLIVGGHDHEVIRLNEAAAAALRCPHELAIVPGATHLFNEPGTLEQAAALARDWFVRHLTPLLPG
ncbi:putative phosphoribosyl transferase [Pseudoduganella flava]|uniref:Alpha/beta hydrolase n=1 Tax=Pseudoduganella flava TaxID=871742 RepID=A0A562Q0A0_9BURK|nr:dienelactone hydrolase family protein [Pseudoduganella flava]QGZ38567.1 alpha/beta hydrolase [Pseudoduganella flava]TWI49870.1 putative phosphoribosyl transferase [Pseudoduganella flava]